MSVSTLLDGIDQGRIVLPAIQRDFVWKSDRIEKLFDSLFRGYPVGVVLLWDTTAAIQYREFKAEHRSDDQASYKVNEKTKSVQLVLDGQQRLTSLYIALRGTLQGKLLHFDVLSGRKSDDASEEKYAFRFMSVAEAAAYNERLREDEDEEPAYYVALKDFSGPNAPGAKLRRQLAKTFDLDDEDEDRLIENLGRPLSVISDSGSLLQEQVIDQGLPQDHPSRKSVFDILEIFMRINTQGINLTRSDLILSMLRLHWPDATDKLPAFIRKVNKGSSIEIDSDFVIRCIFSVAGLGTRLDIGLLRRKENVAKVKDAYERTTEAILSVVDFVQNDCGLRSIKLMNGLNTLVPFVNYLARKPNKVFAPAEKVDARRALYLIAFSAVLAKHSDSRSGALIRDAIRNEKGHFPYGRVASFVKAKTRIDTADRRLFGNHVPLALALVQGHDDGKVMYSRNLPEIDHIFPRAKHGDEPLIDDIGNFWFLPQHVNRNKKDKPPKEYLAAIDDASLDSALIDRRMLSKGFKRFVEARREAMIEQLQERTGITSL